MLKRSPALLLIAGLLLAGGCGSSSSSSSTTSPAGSSPAAGGSSENGTVLAADAKSAATGDIPDNQNFLTLSGQRLHVSILYPEGWSVQESTSSASIKDKNNIVRIAVAKGPVPTTASVSAQVAALMHSTPGLAAGSPQQVVLSAGPAVKVSYTTQSAPNPVTGKQVTLKVDRYELAHAGRVATIDLGSPTGVDNVDSYKRMIKAFKWL